MPSVLFESDVSGVDVADIGSADVLYVAWYVITRGPRVRLSIEGDDSQLTGVGSFALGHNLSSLGAPWGIAYEPLVWLNWAEGIWSPTPSVVGGGFTSQFAERIRWSLSVNTSVHLRVFG